MNVLQLGSTNWAKEYSIPDDVKWSFNSPKCQFKLEKK